MTTTLNASTAGAGGFIATGDNSGSLALQTAGTTAITVDTSQNVGIGTSSPASKLHVYGATDSKLTLQNSNNSCFVANLSGSMYVQSADIIGFNTGGATERMRIDTSGSLLVNMTTSSTSTVGGAIQANGKVRSNMAFSTNAEDTWDTYSTTASAFRFYVDMGGTIHATSTSITAISDQTLKTNIKDLETGLAEVMALKPRRFDWINGDGTNVAGFISQEVEPVLPDLVQPYKYSEDENGNRINKLGLKMGDMLPTLVKAIQELKAINDTQAATINALTARLVALESK